MSRSELRKTGERRQRQPSDNAKQNAGPPRRWFWWLLGGVALCLGAAATYYLIDFVIWPRVPPALVGKWRVVNGEQIGVELEFSANGAFQARLSQGNEGAIVQALAQVDGPQIHLTSTDPDTGERDIKTHVIRQLTEKDLTLEDPSGRTSRLVRIE